MKSTNKISFSRWAMWSFGVLFFFYDMFTRTYPAVIIDDLMHTFHIKADEVAFLDSFYFYIFALMQIPVGILLDRYGAAKLFPFAMLLSGCGDLLYGLAPLPWVIGIARLLTGVGASFAFIGMIYISSQWFEKKHCALLIGIGTAVGFLGAFAAQGPTAYLQTFISWRALSIMLGTFGIVLALLTYLNARYCPKNIHIAAHSNSFHEALKGLKEVLAHPQSWLNAIIAMLLNGATIAFLSLWGTIYLVQTRTISVANAGFAVSMISIGWIIGAPLIGELSDLFRKRRPFITYSALLASIAFLPIILFDNLSIIFIYIILLIIGVCSSSQIQNYTLTLMLHHDRASGAASSWLHFAAIIGGSMLQLLIGFFLNFLWDNRMLKGIQVFAPQHWKIAMSIFPLAFFIAFLLSFFLKEYYHEEY